MRGLAGRLERAKAGLRKLAGLGVLHVLLSGVSNKVIQFGTLMVLPVVLGKNGFGLWGMVSSTVALFAMFQGLGMPQTVLQFGVREEHIGRSKGLLLWSVRQSLGFNVVLTLFIAAYSVFVPERIPGTNINLLYMMFLPFLYCLFEIQLNYLRSRGANREYSVVNTTNAALFLIGSLLAGQAFGVTGVVVAQYLSFGFSELLAWYFIRRLETVSVVPEVPSHDQRKTYLTYALAASATAALSTILVQIDSFLVGMFLSDSGLLASYRMASVIPTALAYIPVVIVVSIYPYLVKAATDLTLFAKRIRSITLTLFLANVTTLLVVLGLAKPFFHLAYGSIFDDVPALLNVLMIAFFINGTVSIPLGNALASTGKVKYNLLEATVSGLTLLGLNLFLIPALGVFGGAFSKVAVTIVSGSINAALLFRYFRVQRQVTATKA